MKPRFLTKHGIGNNKRCGCLIWWIGNNERNKVLICSEVLRKGYVLEETSVEQWEVEGFLRRRMESGGDDCMDFSEVMKMEDLIEA